LGYLNDIRNFIIEWDVKHPVDHWWRTKYGIPFGSPSHLDMDMIDMRIDFEEEEMLRRVSEERERRDEAAENEALGLNHLTGSGKEIVHMSKDEIEEDYENLDLSQFTDDKTLKESNKDG
jgi:hypothetical protein